jgi:glutamate-1-semialdehyde 2,1-aminomutase
MTPILVRGHEARVEDLDGNWFVEYGMGLRSVTLGHAYEPVVSAVCSAAAEGVNFSRPTVWELRAAEDFTLREFTEPRRLSPGTTNGMRDPS